MEELNIELKSWDYTCGDGCCYDYGTQLFLNGEEIGNRNDGNDVRESLQLVLEKLGYKVTINDTFDGE